MTDELDLDNPPPEAEGETPSQRRRRERQEREQASASAKPKPTAKGETDLVSRLTTAFGKLADQRRSRGDEELAEAIDSNKQTMAQSLVSLTRTISWFRRPLLLFLGLLEPVLAFWQVGTILLGRVFAWRDRVQVERAQYEQTEEQVVGQYRPGATQE